MADPTAADTYLGEFRRGPAIFTVFAVSSVIIVITVQERYNIRILLNRS